MSLHSPEFQARIAAEKARLAALDEERERLRRERSAPKKPLARDPHADALLRRYREEQEAKRQEDIAALERTRLTLAIARDLGTLASKRDVWPTFSVQKWWVGPIGKFFPLLCRGWKLSQTHLPRSRVGNDGTYTAGFTKGIILSVEGSMYRYTAYGDEPPSGVWRPRRHVFTGVSKELVYVQGPSEGGLADQKQKNYANERVTLINKANLQDMTAGEPHPDDLLARFAVRHPRLLLE